MKQKPGLKTTEFWLTLVKGLVGPVLAVLVATGVLTPEIDTDTIKASVMQIAQAVVALVALFVSGHAVTSYTNARTHVKSIQTGVEVSPAISGFIATQGNEEDETENKAPVGWSGGSFAGDVPGVRDLSEGRSS